MSQKLEDKLGILKTQPVISPSDYSNPKYNEYLSNTLPPSSPSSENSQNTSPDAFYYARPGFAGLKSTLHLDKLIGKGGMSKVYLASTEDDQAFVLKLFDEIYGEMPQLFKREIRLQLISSHLIPVPQVYEAGQDQTGLFYLIMDYVPGHTLRWHIDRGKTFSPQKVIQIGKAIAQNLSLLHQQGLIHQDLTPSNIVFSQGRAYFIDFGLAKRAGEPNCLGKNMIVGTPSYMAPEIALQGAQADEHSEQFSLGVILYELLTSNNPIIFDSYQNLRDIREIASCPDPLAEIIMQCLEFYPKDRHPSCTQVAKKLENLQRVAQESNCS